MKGDPYKFFCTTCSRSVSCEHQDVERHTNKQLHQNNAKSLKSQSLIIFPTKQSSSDTEKVGTVHVMLRKILYSRLYGSYDEVKFFSSVRAYYTRAMSYALENFPITDPLLRNASFLNFDTKDDSNFTEVEYFVERYMYCNDNLCLF